MRTHLIRDLFQHLDRDGSLQVGHCPEAEKRRFEELQLPTDVKRVLQWNWPNRGAEVGGYNLYTPKEILASEDQPRLLAVGMLQIGFARNGDLLVLCWTEDKCAVGLVSHDELWEDRDADPREMYVEVTTSIDEYLWRAAEGRFLPVDFYAAIELNEMRGESESG
ncbi:MAG TPA: hypothetical protein VFS76_11710 [Pyrinomonadaceae bacterium]|nr:hypothetical protein [Pyrinomonadaceae bacterium]